MRWQPVTLNTLAFGVAFAAWIVFGPSGRVIAADVGLTEGQGMLVKTIPILTGSVLRLPIGVLTDRIGARLTFAGLLAIGAIAMALMGQASTLPAFLVGGLVLGLVGTTFVVGVQSVSTWSPASRQGLALGIFGAGNIGTAATTLGLPLLMTTIGWRTAFLVYGAMLAVTAVLYFLGMRDAPRSGPRKTLRAGLAPAANPRAWLYGLYYTASFGVFIALSLMIVDLYMDVYAVSIEKAGLLATAFTLTTGLSRIPGGALADRFGAEPVLRYALPLTGLTLLAVMMQLPVALTIVLTIASGLSMGAVMSATFKAIPTEFPGAVGAVGGLVGAIGGLGGFYLPLLGRWMAGADGAPTLALLPLVVLVFATAIIAPLAAHRRSLTLSEAK
jgi:NNP family nitrate/nitrite transporter-like MFS transporter